MADFDAAAEIARKENKDLLVDFTGSDWCGWCMRLDEEVFSHQQFLDGVRESFVLVALDFPRGEEAMALVPEPERNQELSEAHAVAGFPTILLMTAEGEAYGRTGYREGGPGPYVEHLTELRINGRKELAEVKELVADYRKAEGDARLALWNTIADRLQLNGESEAARHLVGPVKDAFQLDPDNKRGMKQRAVLLLLESGKADAAVCAAARQLDPENEDGLYERAVVAECSNIRSEEELAGACEKIDALEALGEIKDPEIATYLYVNAAMWNFQYLENPEKAKKYATKARALAGDNERIVEMMDQILGS